jgi:hypothetical protein
MTTFDPDFWPVLGWASLGVLCGVFSSYCSRRILGLGKKIVSIPAGVAGEILFSAIRLLSRSVLLSTSVFSSHSERRLIYCLLLFRDRPVLIAGATVWAIFLAYCSKRLLLPLAVKDDL